MAGEWWEYGLLGFGLTNVTPWRVGTSFILFRRGNLTAGLWRLPPSSLPGVLDWAEALAEMIAPPLPVEAGGGKRYFLLEDGSAVLLTAWPGVGLPRQKPGRDLADLLLFLARLRRRAEERREAVPLLPGRAWLFSWRERIRRLDSFALVAARRLHPTEFDRIFLRRYETIREEAARSLTALTAALAGIKGETVGLEKIERGFFYRDEDGRIRLKNPGWLVAVEPMRDVYRLLVRYLPRLEFSCRTVVAALELYRAACPTIGREEWEGLLAALLFPEDYYGLACRYFFHLVPWPLSIFLRQERRIWAGEPARRTLVKELGAFLS
ncbi:MAG: hypothetical protein GX493_07710 [Firmicutes bacterium]|nr:hypothetical protein [Bacillota bacterium]